MISAVPGVSDRLSTTGSPIVPDGAGAAQQRVDQLEHHRLRPVEKIEVRDRASFLSERVNVEVLAAVELRLLAQVLDNPGFGVSPWRLPAPSAPARARWANEKRKCVWVTRQ